MRKLTSLKIKGLYGRHDYTLNFNEKGGFTMLAAPNGYGKSTILKIIRAIASGNVFFFEDLNFNKIEVLYEERHFDNLFDSTTGTACLTIEKIHPQKKAFSEKEWLNEIVSRNNPIDDDFADNDVLIHTQRYLNKLKRISTNKKNYKWLDGDENWLDNYHRNIFVHSDPHKDEWTNYYKKFLNYENSYTEATINFYFDPKNVYSLDNKSLENIRKEIKQKFEGTEESLSDLFYKKHPCITIFPTQLDWFTTLSNKMQVPYIYIGANRDITCTEIPTDSYTSVNQLSRLILRNGDIYKEQYNQISQQLDDNLLKSIINTVKDTSSMESLKAQVSRRFRVLNNLKERNAKYGIESDIDKKTNDIDEKAIHTNNNEASLAVINKVLENNIKKLDIFSPYVDQLEFFKNTLDKMLSFVKVKPSFNGLEIYGQNPTSGEEIMLPLEALSSGEHQLITILGIILFYDSSSIFRMVRSLHYTNSRVVKDLSYRLILIDEPEISMHPAWQEDLAEFLWNIKEKYSKEFIIATHSPTFIGRRWNNVFELAELEG